MPLNKLDNIIKNTDGRILYVSPSDLDSTDSISNQGNSLARPFKTLQRALLEAARFSYLKGNDNDLTEKTTILLMPGQHTIDNRPGYVIYDDGGAKVIPPGGGTPQAASNVLSLTLDSNFDITQSDNDLYKFNSISGGVIIPRGVSIIGLDLRKTKIRPKYVPNPTDSAVGNSAIFKITGAGYFWQFCIFDGDESGLVYTDPANFSENNQSKPVFSHHKLTCFEYADGVNLYENTGLTDLDMYYAKVSNAFNIASGRDIDEKYPTRPDGFAKQRPEWEIVGAFASDPINISTIESGSGGTPSNQVTVTTTEAHNLTAGTPIKIRGVIPSNYNISTKVQSIDPTNPNVFTYLLPSFPPNLVTPGNAASATVTIETDTVSGASPYIFNISLRSVYGMNGMHADGSKASGFKSMVVAQFTGVSLQKDDRAFVEYIPSSKSYQGLSTAKVAGASLSSGSSSTNLDTVYHLDPDAIYRSGWETTHIKASNGAFIQIVSVFAIGFNKHFDCDTGGDMSITNSNSNFGQISLSSSGFRADAFNKDDQGFITSIISPRAIEVEEEEINWFELDVSTTDSVGLSTHLYIAGFDSEDTPPPSLTQGYRIGARVDDVLYLRINGTEYSADILISDGVTSSVKEYVVTSGPTSNIFTIGSHTIETGEKVIILSDVGDLPQNIEENIVYYAIRHSSTQIKLASTEADALSGVAVEVYLGTNLRILSRVSDKSSGDIGHPVQFDSVNERWYLNVASGNGIYDQISTLGVAGLGARTDLSYFRRIADSRSLDEKIYKIRVVIPKESTNARNPEDGFVIQESGTTGARSNLDFNIGALGNLTLDDYGYNRNPSYIAACSRDVGSLVDGSVVYVVTVTTQLPHNLKVGDSVEIKNIPDTSINPDADDNSGYNGIFTVTSVASDMIFTYEITQAVSTPVGIHTFARNTFLPRFVRKDLQSNLYAYRNEVISNYVSGSRDGVYHIYVLNANNAVSDEFTSYKYSQNVVDLYPQLDRDNINDSPQSAKSFAVSSPLGKVVTNDLKKSITRESIDSLLVDLGNGLEVSSISNSATSATITFSKEHGLSGICTGSVTSGASYDNGTYYNVKLLNGSQTGTWSGATANVVVIGGAVVSAEVVSSGSGYSAGDLYFDETVIGTGNGNARFTVTTAGISSAVGNVVQFTGVGTATDTYHRITSVLSNKQISIAKTSGDPVVIENQYAFIVHPSIAVNTSSYDSQTGITTFNCSSAHGLSPGNRFRIIDSSNNNLGDYLVKTRVGVNTFTAVTNQSVSPSYVLKHGISSNDGVSDNTGENLSIRGVPLFGGETLNVVSFTSDTQIRVSSNVSIAGTTFRFPYGSYIQINDEIMRIASDTLGGTFNDEITVIRGYFSTQKQTHAPGSLIKKIRVKSIELRRPSISRASGHTFEYLGYGPGNYSTGLPQVQIKDLTEREEFLVQAQEKSCGIVVYTGMNSNGDFFVGNQKKSSATGEEVTFDTPIPTITGEDPSRLSVVFDEVIVKERLVVEGGNSNQILSQFDGPVTFSNDAYFKKNLILNGTITSNSGVFQDLSIKSLTENRVVIVGSDDYLEDSANLTFDGDTLNVGAETQSTSVTSGALVVDGGAGISSNVNIGGSLTVNATTSVGSSLSVSQNKFIRIGDAYFSSGSGETVETKYAWMANHEWYNGSAWQNPTQTNGGLYGIQGQVHGWYKHQGSDQQHTQLAQLDEDGNFIVIGDITAFGSFSSDDRLKTNRTKIDNALEKIHSLNGFTFNWNENAIAIFDYNSEDRQVGVSAQEVQKVLPEAVKLQEWNDEEVLIVKYEKLVPLLVEAIKELSHKVEVLEQKLQDK